LFFYFIFVLKVATFPPVENTLKQSVNNKFKVSTLLLLVESMSKTAQKIKDYFEQKWPKSEFTRGSQPSTIPVQVRN